MAVPVTVSFPSTVVPFTLEDLSTTTLEYRLICRDVPEEGKFGPGEPGPVNGKQGFLWTTSLRLAPGSCSIYIQMRDDATQEVVCWAEQDFEVPESAEVSIFMGCESW